MSSSLYDGILDEKESPTGVRDTRSDISGWGSSFKVMQTQRHINAKKSMMQPRKRQSATMAPVVDLKRGGDELYFNQITGKLERRSSIPVVATPFIASEPPSAASLLGVTDEYDPLRPNDYEDFVKKRKKEREEERKKDDEKRRREPRLEKDDEFDRRRRHREEEEEEEQERERDRERTPRAGGGAAIAPPMSLIEQDTVPVIEQGNMEPGRGMDEMKPVTGTTFGMAGSVASKIMAKYGYREGQGLGKKEQGMSIALQVEKTSKRGGKIIHEKDLPKLSEQQQSTSATNANLLRNPSKVLLLRNMVGPGDVDEHLEAETTEECTKYGKVNKCVIFEMPNTTEDEAVRIFLEFERMESAIKAVVDLNGRYFGGRVVKAGFYNLDRFRQLDLGGEME